MEDSHSLRGTTQSVRHAKWRLYQTEGAHSWGRSWFLFSELFVDQHQQEVTSTYKDLSNGHMVQQA